MSPLFDATCVREQWLIAKEKRFWFKIMLKMLGKTFVRAAPTPLYVKGLISSKFTSKLLIYSC